MRMVCIWITKNVAELSNLLLLQAFELLPLGWTVVRLVRVLVKLVGVLRLSCRMGMGGS